MSAPSGSADENVRFVHDVRFRPVRFRDGYEMAPVDDLIDQLAAAFGEVRRRGAARPA
ncbi:DivIVA domain-containing protein [Pimelobacter simplex]|uniref:Uncharacterized protein n=1 Tax=Nocardioides simplex TaxID=2045 RepID=A0A0C5XMR2_NOCSI|nr:DivIVA domain-containing protein [Pimelobacter simplex]AJR18752.1 hypothetical protein KR76_00154 [Pimelobacter simplex]MCG8149093.1 DivIVA domain-containing protein [Pimelobacter simplex]GEB14898.1 hypothetical protein NSI01_32130 [Pimelobacter simplex]SFM23713.1 DivIVA domain-containing protein [Pimelobacter simplex]